MFFLGLCELVDFDCKGDSCKDVELIKWLVVLFYILSVYIKFFEFFFLVKIREFFKDFVGICSVFSFKEYIKVCEKFI